jgi:glycosyltransferase involved in cell wall biosynthesis
MAPLNVDVLVITRNRPAALGLSLPLVLRQSYCPQQVIIVDSSDDKEPVSTIVANAAKSSSVPIVLLHSTRGTSLQRNVGLKRVTAEITLFLDDDSIVLDGAIAAIMRVYQLDKDEVIGGVCSREATEAPPNFFAEAKTRYKMTAFDRVKLRVAPLRYKFEQFAFPDPLQLHGESRQKVRRAPDWLASENAVLVEHMTGFRMSFRTNLVKQFGFDEVLNDYALGEDIETSFSALKTHLLVGARNAAIFHYKDPGRRADGAVIGVTHILNNAYIVCKHAAPNSPARVHLKSFFRYKLALYAVGQNSHFGRQKFVGALRAYRCLPKLMNADLSELSSVYVELRRQCLISDDALIQLPADRARRA